MREQQTKTFKLEKVAEGSTKRPRHDVWECTLHQINERGHTHMKWQWGVKNGRLQIRERTYSKGLQKRNPWEQALLECDTMIDAKLYKGYIYTLDSEIVNNRDVIEKDHQENEKIATEVLSYVPFVMLAHDFDKYPNMIENRCGFLMPKLDGIFAMANVDTGEIWARSRKPIDKMKHIEEAVLQFGKTFESPHRWIVGELYRHGWEFQKISGLVRTSKVTPEKLEVSFHVFDLICDKSFGIRRLLLENGLYDKENIHLVECKKVALIEHEYKEYHKTCSNQGYEGIMIHRYVSTENSSEEMPGYLQDKRTDWLLKYKEFIQEEYICVGVNPQKHREIAGSVVLKTKDGIEFSATPKMSDELKKQIWESKNEYIGQIGTVKFFSYHPGPEGKPRFPNLIGFRHPDDITNKQ